MRILIVEHRADVRLTLLRQIRGWDFAALAVDDGNKAWQILANENLDRIDMVIADLAIPGVDGLKLVERIRRYPKHANLPVLLICEIAKKRDVMEAAQVGVSGFLTLPLDARTCARKYSRRYEITESLTSNVRPN
jgi:CheY-like chemotaxis protein